MTIRHHPDDATLMSFAAGALPQAFAAIVAAHLSMCPRCRDEITTFELVGAALIDTLPPRTMEQAAPAANMGGGRRCARPRAPHGGAAHPLAAPGWSAARSAVHWGRWHKGSGSTIRMANPSVAGCAC
jgi:putative transcriptional regulator